MSGNNHWEETVSLTVNGLSVQPRYIDNFLIIEPAGKALHIVLSYSLPVRRITERTLDVDFTIQFTGDDITGISPNTDFYPLYPSL